VSEHITQGVHDLSAEAYLDAEGVSCSMLNILAEKTPMHLYAWIKGQREEQTDALHFGTLVHYAILQGDLYKKKFHVRPEGMKMTTKEGRAWKEDHSDKPDISFEDALAISGMVESVRHHRFASRLLSEGKPEQSLFVYDEADTLRKSRLDFLSKGNVLADVKTCTTASLKYFERQVSQFRYHVRAAYYLDNCRLLGMDKEHFVFIAVEKLPPYAVRCLKLNGDAVEFGKKCYQADLQTYRNCVANDQWPGWEEGYTEVALPPWEMKQILELI
jgi:hypothetical protein